MNTTSRTAADSVIQHVSADEWQVLDGDLVVGRGHIQSTRPGKRNISVDAWRAEDFYKLATAMLRGQRGPLHTIVDESDAETIANWRRIGMIDGRRERLYLLDLAELPTSTAAPEGVRIAGDGDDAQAHLGGIEVGAIRLLPVMRTDGTPRIVRIQSLEVGTGHRRRGIGRALMVHALATMKTHGFALASADVDDTNTAAIHLLESLEARWMSSSMELTWQR